MGCGSSRRDGRGLVHALLLLLVCVILPPVRARADAFPALTVPYKEIAEYFKISEDTVKHHLSNIFDKVGVSSRLELALFAVNQSLPFKPIT